MPKRKAETPSQLPVVNESKKVKYEAVPKLNKQNLLDDSDSSSSEDESGEGALLEEPGFKINEEYAKRFEHNKKREELQRLEEKYEKPTKSMNKQYGDKYDEDSESSDDEDEDDDGFLATEALDAEISATLQAIRSKDPRVYDEKVTFYASIEEDENDEPGETKRQKPMFLTDYHRENLLKGHTGVEEIEEAAPRTFAQEQEDLKKSIVKEMHAAAVEDSTDNEDDDGAFLKPKSKQQAPSQEVHPSRASKFEIDVAVADKDPEKFLSNFMEARAWVPSDSARFQPLESDDDEEDERAEQFETAYNLRFEDPKGSNEMLRSYARDVVAAKSVRREEPNSRKKQRDAQREKREREKAERDDERAQLRRLKIDEMEEKLHKIKKAAGIRGKSLKDEEWMKFLDEGWDDGKWEAEMNRRFGEDYYAEEEAGSDNESDSEEGNGARKKKKAKKPKWDDDIDIKDLIPDFEDDSNEKPAFTLSDSDEENDDDATFKQSKSSKGRQQEKLAKKKAARIERKRIEDLVDSRLGLDLPFKSKQAAFRYRETSPTSFGLTAKDILMAPDASLNQFAGLKKMASFRDPEKKRKDKKNLGKKARLRQWRKETFGNEDGPEITIGGDAVDMVDKNGVDIVEGKKKKKRSRKNKGQISAGL